MAAAAVCRERFREAMGWRREVERELSELGLTLAQWTVLDATRDLTASTEDAVSQNDVAVHTDIDRMTISQVMRNLSDRGLVSRGPDASGRAYRIWLSKKGELAVMRGAQCVEKVSAAWLARRSGFSAQGKISRST
jgi:DNA-binding MarR family transcriptional regulator